MNVQKYNQVAHQTMALLNEVRPDAKTWIPRKVRSKAEFGDVDIVLALQGSSSINRTVDLVRHNLEYVGVTNFSRNGHNLEFEVLGETVDLIIVADQSFESAAFYYDNGYFGMLLGALASYHSLKLGFEGLFYKHETKSQVHDVLVTRDPRQAMHVLGLDYHRDFLPGFETPEEVFDVVLASPLFSKAAFESENRSHRQRDRDKRRDQWDEFRSFLKSKDEVPNRSAAYIVTYLHKILPESSFAELRRSIETIEARQELFSEAKSVFNGNHVMDELGIEGKDLGLVMDSLREPFDSKEEYARHVLDKGTQGMLDEARELLAHS